MELQALTTVYGTSFELMRHEVVVGLGFLVLAIIAFAVRRAVWRDLFIRPHFAYLLFKPYWCYVVERLIGWLFVLLIGTTCYGMAWDRIIHPLLGYSLGTLLLLLGLTGIAFLTFSKKAYRDARRKHLEALRRCRRSQLLPWLPGSIFLALGLAILCRSC